MHEGGYRNNVIKQGKYPWPWLTSSTAGCQKESNGIERNRIFISEESILKSPVGHTRAFRCVPLGRPQDFINVLKTKWVSINILSSFRV